MVSVLDSGAAWVQIAAATLSGNSLRQSVHTHRASVHRAAYRRFYDLRHLQVDCQKLGSAPEPYATFTSFSFELSDGTRSRRRFAQAPIAVGSVVLTKHVRLVADRTPLAFVSRRNQREIPTQQWRPHCAFKLFLRSTQLKQVQHPPSVVNVTLPAFVAELHRLQSRSISPASGALSSKPASPQRLSIDGQTDGRTDGRSTVS